MERKQRPQQPAIRRKFGAEHYSPAAIPARTLLAARDAHTCLNNPYTAVEPVTRTV